MNDWIEHKAGDTCPIPWAKAGEFEYTSNKDRVSDTNANKLLWGAISRYRLTDRWLPVINGKCPQSGGWESGSWEYKLSNGSRYRGIQTLEKDLQFSSAVAVRLIIPQIEHQPTVQALNIEECLSKPARSSAAYSRFRASPRGKEALAQIGKTPGATIKSLGQCEIERLIIEAMK